MRVAHARRIAAVLLSSQYAYMLEYRAEIVLWALSGVLPFIMLGLWSAVDAGDGRELSVVCGAPNARTGIKVAVAQVGAVLPGDFKIKNPRFVANYPVACFAASRSLGFRKKKTALLN